MLGLLQTGKALYALAVICGLGVLTKWLTRNLYKRLIKESDNMTLTKNKNLRSLKQKAETTYQMNQGIPKVKPYLERQMYELKFMGITLHGWNLFSNQMTLLCFLAGAAGAFASYWFHAEPNMIVLYGSAGILAGLFTILVDHGMGIGEKKQQLFVSLDNYLENNLFNRLNQDRDQDSYGERIPERRQENRDNIRAIYPGTEPETVSSIKETQPANVSRRQRQKAERPKSQQAPEARVRGRQPMEESIPEPIADAAGPAATTGSRKDVDYLKHSLEQIAVSRERQKDVKKEEDWLKDLNPDELKLIGEIIHQYLT